MGSQKPRSDAAALPVQVEGLKDYILQRHIGAGGMADVYLADKVGVGGFSRTVALKLIKQSLVEEDPSAVMSFIDEARLSGSLTHPHILSALDCGQLGGRFYIAMEYIEGPSLHELLCVLAEEGRALPLSEALEIVRQAAEGLSWAHLAPAPDGTPLKLIHRDIKPSNLLITRHGQVKVADFGIAKAEMRHAHTQQSGIAKGTLRFMSPEQALGLRDIDQRSDVFSLSVLFFEVLAGERLYLGDSHFQILRFVQDGRYGELEARLPEMPHRADLLALLKRGLALDRDARFSSAEALARALEALQEGLPRPRVRQLIDEIWPRLQARRQAKAEEAQRAQVRRLETLSLLELDAHTQGSLSGVPTQRMGTRGDTEAPVERPRLMGGLRWGALVVLLLLGGVGAAFLTKGPSAPAPMGGAEARPSAQVEPEGAASVEVIRDAPPPEVDDGPTPAPPFAEGAPREAQIVAVTPKPVKALVATPRAQKAAEVAAAPLPGYLSVNALGGGTILLDGRRLGSQRILEEVVSEGAHTLTIEWADHPTLSRGIQIRSRKRLGCFARPGVDSQIECE